MGRISNNNDVRIKLPDTTDESLRDSNEALAIGLEQMGTTLTNRHLLFSVIKSDKEQQRILLMLSVGREAGYQFLTDLVKEQLQTNVSKQSGRGRKDFTTILQHAFAQGTLTQNGRLKRLVSFVKGE